MNPNLYANVLYPRTYKQVVYPDIMGNPSNHFHTKLDSNSLKKKLITSLNTWISQLIPSKSYQAWHPFFFYNTKPAYNYYLHIFTYNYIFGATSRLLFIWRKTRPPWHFINIESYLVATSINMYVYARTPARCSYEEKSKMKRRISGMRPGSL